MAKIDIKSAYRHVGIHPSQFPVTGLQWQFNGDSKPTYMFDTRLMFGASESVGTFHRITQSIVRMMRKRVKNCSVLCYLDDFLIISKNKHTCANATNILTNLLQDLGFTINWTKLVPPTQTITFLGIAIDSNNLSISIPDTKLSEIKECANTLLQKQKLTKRELQSLIGKIAWGAKCIKAIRPTLRSLIDLQKRLKHSSHRTRLSQNAKLDIQFFLQWCVRFNGVVFFCKTDKPQPDTTLYCDASLKAGAAYHNSDFVYVNWQADMQDMSSEPIFVKEVGAIILAFRRWHPRWSYKTIHVYTDNKGAEWALRKGLTKNASANIMLKELLWLCAWYNISYKMHYISTKDNYIADALSRLDDPRFQSHALAMLYANDIDILHPMYNLLYHMSLNSYYALFS